jgi:hypothetical protein
MSPKQVWSLRLVARELSCFLSVMWHGEALYGLGVQGVKVLILLGAFFFAKSGSTISARFLTYGAHSVCFSTAVAIMDPPVVVFLMTASRVTTACLAKHVSFQTKLLPSVKYSMSR